MRDISTKKINNNRRRQSVGGYRNPPTGSSLEKLTLDLPVSVQKRIKESSIDTETFERLLYFAKYQPSGKRQLNEENLSYLIIGNDEPSLTDTQGLRKGGLVSEDIEENSSRKGLKKKQLNLNIKNNNRLKTNPNYSSFKNNFKIK